MPQFRRRDTGTLVEARRVSGTETAETPFYRISPFVAPNGLPYRSLEGTHQVTIETGQWRVQDGEHVYPYPDEYFPNQFVPVEDHEFVAHADLAPTFDEVARREAEDAVANGQRFSELHGDLQNADRVQMHAALVAHLAGDDDRANRILKQRGLPTTFPDNIPDLLARQGEFVDAATVAFLDQQNEVARLREQVRRLQGGQGQ